MPSLKLHTQEQAVLYADILHSRQSPSSFSAKCFVKDSAEDSAEDIASFSEEVLQEL